MFLLLAACEAEPDPCPTFAETVITNPDGAAPVEAMAEARATLAEFVGWSGRDGLCVEEIRLQAEVIGTRGGVYGGMFHPRGLIEIDYSIGVDDIVRHELCHAVDSVEGWASEGRPDLFPDTPHEAFAEICEVGPMDLTLGLALDATCATTHGEAEAFVDALAWPDADVVTTPPTGALPLEVERRVVKGLPKDWDFAPVVAAGAIWALGWDEKSADVVIRTDPTTGLATTRPPPAGVERPVLAAAEDGALLLMDTDEPYGAWQLVGDRWIDLPFPALDSVVTAVAIGGDVWVVGQRPEDPDTLLLRIEQGTGAIEARDLPDEVSGVRRDGDTLLAYARDDNGRFWLRYDIATDTWTREENPEGWRPLQRRTLPDGRELVTWEAYSVQRYDVAGLGLRDPTTGEFWSADAPCDEDEIALSNELLVVDGQPWLWEFSNGWIDGPYAGRHALVKVEVP